MNYITDKEYELSNRFREFVFSKVQNSNIEWFNEYLMACCFCDRPVKEYFEAVGINLDCDLYASYVFGLLSVDKKFKSEYINFYWLNEFLANKGMPTKRLRRMSNNNLKRYFQTGNILKHEARQHFKNILLYRRLCNFRIDHNIIQSIKGYDLLSKHGWYHHERNPYGVVRDHRYSVHDGFSTKVDPAIVGNLANCELMLMRDNLRKSHRSSITLEALKKEIEAFNIFLDN